MKSVRKKKERGRTVAIWKLRNWCRMSLEKFPQQMRDTAVCTQMKTEATYHDTPLQKLDTNSIPPTLVSCGSPDTVRRGIGIINLQIGISKRIK